MILRMSLAAVILLASFTVADFARIRPDGVEEQAQFNKHPQNAAQTNEEDTTSSVIRDNMDRAFKDEANSSADGAEADSAGAPIIASGFPAALTQEEASVFSPALAASQDSVLSPAINATVRKELGVVPDEPPSKKRKVQSATAPSSSFSKILDYVIRIRGDPYQQEAVLKAACDSSAFSCEDIIQLTEGLHEDTAGSNWVVGINGAVKLFAEGRNNKGCISDPANAKSIVDSLEGRSDPYHQLDVLKEAFINNERLEPATDLGPPPSQLHTGLRTRKDMRKLLADMAELQLIKAYESQGSESLGESHKLQFTRGRWVGGLYQPGGPSEEEFERWLKWIRANGEQFSGPQLVSLVEAIPNAPLRGAYFEHGTWKGDGLPERNWSMHEKMERNSGTAQAASVLLQYLEQYLTGVTCGEVKQIIQHVMWAREDFFFEGLGALKSNIIDGQNKVDIVAITYSFGGHVLRDVGVGLPPKNNPIFGVVKGNPVIFVVDESTSMDASFTLGDETFTRRQFCSRQLETVLEGLSNGTYFNVIQYSGSAAKIFQNPVLASKTNIDAAMQAMGTTWRADYTPGQDPVKMLRSFKMFALNFKDRLNQSTKRNSMEALRLAYATAGLPSQSEYGGQDSLHDLEGMTDFFQDLSEDFWQWTPKQLATTEDFPQIYFLTSGQPDGASSQILERIAEFDRGRLIPVNSIAFIKPAELLANQFAKDLARETGGFFRSIE